MKSPSTVKLPSKHRHDGFTVTPSRAYMKARRVTVGRIGGYGLACLRPCAYNERMKTLTITEGRGRLGYWLKKATQGADVGFMFEGKVVALRPVEVVSADYALQEYGLTPDEMAAAEKRIGAEIKSARKRGEVSKFTGGKNDFR